MRLMQYLQVDLKCLKPAPGGYYYPSHLPVLGEISKFCTRSKECLIIFCMCYVVYNTGTPRHKT